MVTSGTLMEPYAPHSLGNALLAGLAQTLALESPGVLAGHVDLDPRMDEESAAHALVSEMLGADRPAGQVALRDGHRLVPRLERSATSNSPLVPAADASYLITGASGGVGTELACALANAGARHLWLASRRAPALSPETRTLFESLRVHARLVAVDVSDRHAVSELLDRIDADGPPLRGIVHAAGTTADAVLTRQSWDAFARVAAPKVLGALNLHHASRARRLDFFVLCASAAGLLGSHAQANYAAANAFLGALARVRRAQGLPAQAIAWGPWRDTGLARADRTGRLASLGVEPLDPADAAAVMFDVHGLAAPEIAALSLDAPALARGVLGQHPLLAHLTGGAVLPTTPAGGGRRVAEQAPAQTRRRVVESLIGREVRSVLHLEDGKPIDRDRGFFELGMDSLMALELKNRLEHTFALPLTTTIAFDAPSVAALAQLIVDRLTAPSLEPAPPPGAPAPSASESDATEIAQELAKIERLLR
jgi:short-subunit dehydrogenase/acyl carrier protein